MSRKLKATKAAMVTGKCDHLLLQDHYSIRDQKDLLNAMSELLRCGRGRHTHTSYYADRLSQHSICLQHTVLVARSKIKYYKI